MNSEAAPQRAATWEPRLFGSRRLHRWIYKTPHKNDVNYDVANVDLIKLITIAKFEADLNVGAAANVKPIEVSQDKIIANQR